MSENDAGSTTGEPLLAVSLETPEGTFTVRCGTDEYVWDAAQRSGIQLPSICRQGRCLTCAGMLTAGEVDQRDADVYFPEDRAAGFVLLCRAKPLSALSVRTHQEWEMRRHRKEHGLPAPYG
jgi:ferredoxin